MATSDNIGNSISGHSPLRFQDLSPNIQLQLRNITYAAHELKAHPNSPSAKNWIEGLAGSIEDIFQELDPSPELRKAWRLEECVKHANPFVSTFHFTTEEIREIAEMLRDADQYKLGHP